MMFTNITTTIYINGALYYQGPHDSLTSEQLEYIENVGKFQEEQREKAREEVREDINKLNLDGRLDDYIMYLIWANDNWTDKAFEVLKKARDSLKTSFKTCKFEYEYYYRRKHNEANERGLRFYKYQRRLKKQLNLEAYKRRIAREKKRNMNTIKEELIAQAAHPKRVQYSMSLCDDLEEYFENI